MLWVVIGVIVVVIVIILALVLTGVLFPAGASGSSSPRSFSSARGSAQSTADGNAGGPWTLSIAVGVATANSTTGGVSNLTTIAGSVAGTQCTFTPAPGAPTSIQAPGVGNVSRGTAGAWVYIYSNATGAVLLVSVVGGTPTTLGTLTGTGCNIGTGLFSPIPSTGIVDSTTAAQTATTAGGAAFLSAHPQANATYVLFGGISLGGAALGPTWLVEYMTCSLSGTGPSTAPAFEAVISASSGGLEQAQTTTTTCASASVGKQPIGTALALGPPLEASAGLNTWYNFSIQSAANPLTLGNLQFQIQTAAGAVVTPGGAWTLQVLGLTGTPVGTYSMTSGVWTAGSSTPASSQQLICLDAVGANLSGDTLVVTGTGSFGGTISVAIP